VRHRHRVSTELHRQVSMERRHHSSSTVLRHQDNMVLHLLVAASAVRLHRHH
jgi:hypothetical protein